MYIHIFLIVGSFAVICSLSYLHSKKIVHRDVKTENMLLDSHRTLKIADFGVARVEAQNPRDMTGETGTLGYMAPEVLMLDLNWICFVEQEKSKMNFLCYYLYLFIKSE